MFLGDYSEDYAELAAMFVTRDPAGNPVSLASGVASVYKSNDGTESTAGVTLTPDFDGITGLNHVLVDLGADAFYATGEDYAVYVSGTVGGIAYRRAVAHFSIENRVALSAGVDAPVLGSITAVPLVGGTISGNPLVDGTITAVPA